MVPAPARHDAELGTEPAITVVVADAAREAGSGKRAQTIRRYAGWKYQYREEVRYATAS